MPPKKKRRFSKFKKIVNINNNEDLITRPNRSQNVIGNKVEHLSENRIPSLETNLLTPETYKSKQQIEIKQPIIAPNGKVFYPCQHCNKIFPRETTCKTHIEKCLSKSKFQPDLDKNKVVTIVEDMTKNSDTINKSVPSGHKNFCEVLSPERDCNNLFSKKITYTSQVKKIPENISRNDTIVKNESLEARTSIGSQSGSISEGYVNDPVHTKSKYDLSVYDYNEEDSNEESSKRNTDIKCKVCPFIAETPIDLLRHKRELHKVERKILPPHEIQKYFDYPDRTFCPICEQPIKSRNFRSIFVKHLLVHTAGLTYECRICKKKFRRIDHMRTHERRHVLTFAELQALQDTVDDTPVDGLPFILN